MWVWTTVGGYASHALRTIASEYKVYQLLKREAKGKSHGQENMRKKNLLPRLPPFYVIFSNSSLTEGIVLVLKKQVVTVLIPKTNPHNSLDDLRPHLTHLFKIVGGIIAEEQWKAFTPEFAYERHSNSSITSFNLENDVPGLH